jgi:LEA14-like dessication related protein
MNLRNTNLRLTTYDLRLFSWILALGSLKNSILLKTLLRITVVVSLVLAFNSCNDIQEIKVGNINEVEIKGIQGNMITIKATVPIENPNNFDVKLTEADLKVYMKNNEIGKVKQIDDILILGKTSKDYPITITVELTNIKEIMTTALMAVSGGMHDVRLTGTVIAKSFIYKKKIKIEDFPIIK